MGKSVISAQVHQRYFNHVLAYHYCISAAGAEYRDPTAIVKSIMVQLYDRLPPYAAELDGEFKPQLEEFLGQGFVNAINLWKSFVVAPLGKIEPELAAALLARLQASLRLENFYLFYPDQSVLFTSLCLQVPTGEAKCDGLEVGRSPRFCILIDAVDESGLASDKDNNDLLIILKYHLALLPSWLVVLISGRPESQLIESLGRSAHVF
jgi:hypothetical protein